jgi:hypothetical protein
MHLSLTRLPNWPTNLPIRPPTHPERQAATAAREVPCALAAMSAFRLFRLIPTPQTPLLQASETQGNVRLRQAPLQQRQACLRSLGPLPQQLSISWIS